MRSSIRINLVIAALLALLVVGLTAAPATAELQRFAVHRALRLQAPELPAHRRQGHAARHLHRATAAAGSPGYRAPIDFSDKISNKIAFTYSARIATAGQCRHDLGSTTDQRFRTVGLRDDTERREPGLPLGGDTAGRWSSSGCAAGTRRPATGPLTGARSRTATSVWPASAWRVIRAAAPPSSSTSTAGASTDRSRLVESAVTALAAGHRAWATRPRRRSGRRASGPRGPWADGVAAGNEACPALRLQDHRADGREVGLGTASSSSAGAASMGMSVSVFLRTSSTRAGSAAEALRAHLLRGGGDDLLLAPRAVVVAARVP